MPRHREALRRVGLVGGSTAALLLVLSACGSGDHAGRFVTGDEAAYPVACMEHQEKTPDAEYTGGENATTVQVLQMLRYYTANRTVAGYCDGKPATATDRKWAQLYADLGAEPANVKRLLS